MFHNRKNKLPILNGGLENPFIFNEYLLAID